MSDSWRYRKDEPGQAQFVTVKGVGGLPVFALRQDVRLLLSLLAREVRAGVLAIFCYAFLQNHAHFLVTSRTGRIYRPLKRALEDFARYYNRTRGRVGHVFKDRFHSSSVTSEAYFLCCTMYTDHNPVKAGLALLSTEYEFGSARHFVRPRAPLWLSRDRVSSYVPGADPETGFVPEEAYLRSLGRVDMDLVADLVERRTTAEKDLDDPLDLFFAPDRAGCIAWLLEQARIADGTAGARLLAKPVVLLAIVEERSGRRDWCTKDRATSPFPWRTLLVGLLRFGSARTGHDIERMLGISPSTASRESLRHRDLLLADRDYLSVAEGILRDAVRASFLFLPQLPIVRPDGSSQMKGR